MTPPIWTPTTERVQQSQMFAFMQQASASSGRELSTYDELWQWSVDEPRDFWSMVWDTAGMRARVRGDNVVDDPKTMPGAEWFPGTTLNFAENLLRYNDDREAIAFRGEAMHATRRMTYRELNAAVGACTAAMKSAGVEAGDRVAGFMPNLPETIVAMLAATSLGAIWSSCSPDFGIKGVLDRFARIQPKVLFTADGYSYGGKSFDCLEKIEGILDGLETKPLVVVVPYCGGGTTGSVANGVMYDAFLGPHDGTPCEFTAQPFSHPVYIMYSSGTTGLPKCIVQSAGGILLNQLKEHVLHVDLRRDDRIFYFTTCGWMMWNWLVAALGVGATLVLFDGSPFHPDPSSLMRLAADESVSVFGASAKYFAALEKAGVKPREHFDLAPLRSVLSTGSPLSDESFDFLYRDVKPDMQVASISGGTDLNGCFVAGSPMLPVYRGEIQCRCLGMDVHAWSEDGEPLEGDRAGEQGELVCTTAFPSMPVFFWGDDDGSKYRAAYFDRFPGVWHHGDYIEVNDHGGVRISGRSDATLNPGGVRMGTAEIYRQVEPMDEVLDALVVGQEWGDDQRVILFVHMAPGHELTPALTKRIRTAIRTGCSPRHVPAKVIAVGDIPYTISGKKVELAVRNLVHGKPVSNRDALKNPDALDYFTNLPELQED